MDTLRSCRRVIHLNNTGTNNGYLGFIDPSPYFGKPEETKTEEKLTEEKTPGQNSQSSDQPKVEEQKKDTKPPEETSSPQPEKESKEPEVKEVIKEVIKEVPVVNQEEVQKQVEERLQERLKLEQDERRKLANEARIQRKKDNLNQILEFVRKKKVVTNDDIFSR